MNEIVPPTPERMKKGDVRELHGARGGREVRSTAHPLNYYLGRDIITPPQWDAGTRLAELWELGYARSRFAQGKYGDPTSRGSHQAGYADECRDLYHRAAGAIRDVPTRKLVFEVCCDERYAGKRIDDLRRGLDALYRHFYRNGKLS